jgi:hypothetical protein
MVPIDFYGDFTSFRSKFLHTAVFIYNGERISNLTVEAPLTSEMGMQVDLDFTLLAGSQQPLGVMRTNFTHVGAMGHVLIQDIKDMDTYMDLDTPAYLTSEFS